MAKELRTENWRVVVFPEMLLCHTDDEKQKGCQSLVRDIQRHIDGVVSVDWQVDEVNYCSLCGSVWETWGDGSPACCEAAIDEHMKTLGGQNDG